MLCLLSLYQFLPAFADELALVSSNKSVRQAWHSIIPHIFHAWAREKRQDRRRFCSFPWAKSLAFDDDEEEEEVSGWLGRRRGSVLPCRALPLHITSLYLLSNRAPSLTHACTPVPLHQFGDVSDMKTHRALNFLSGSKAPMEDLS